MAAPSARLKVVRIPFPEHIPMWRVMMFTFVLAAFQMVQGTSVSFMLGSAAYIMIAALAFNTAGGMAWASGTYIFFNTTLTVIVGLILKAFYFEPADSNLKVPDITIMGYVGTAISLLVAAYVTKFFRRRRGLLEPLLVSGNSRIAALGCLLVGTLLPLTYEMFGVGQSGSIGSILAQLNHFSLISILLGTYHAIRSSNGRSAINSIVLVGCGYTYLQGVLSYSKEGLFLPLMAWLLVAVAMRFNFRLSHLLVFSALLGFTVIYMVPYAQGGRNDRAAEGSAYEKAARNLGRLEELRKAEEDFAASEKKGPHYFVSAGTLAERLQMISMDDALIDSVEQEGPMGGFPIWSYYLNLIPHFLWPAKPFWVWGNVYAHRIGMLGDEDNTTGISFSPLAEAYVTFKWIGVFGIMPAVWSMLFLVVDSVSGTNRNSPWGLFYTALFAHVAVEGMLGGAIGVSTIHTTVVIFVAFLSTYIMPLIGRLVQPETRHTIGSLKTTPASRIQRKLGEV